LAHDYQQAEIQLGRNHWSRADAGQDSFPAEPGAGSLVEYGLQGPVKILVVDRRGEFADDVERAARQLDPAPKIVVESHPTRVMEQVVADAPDIVLVAPEEMTTTGLRRLAQVHRAVSSCVIALTQERGGPPVSMTDAALCGATESLVYPATPVKMRNALSRIIAVAESRMEQVVIREVVTKVPAPAAPQAPLPAAGGRVFTVTSPTGGCGKTFFATNLAAYLAGVTGGRVLLIDLDLQFGEVSLALGLHPERTVADLIGESSYLQAFPEYVITHSAGYQVLSAPNDPFSAEMVGPREATAVLEAARALYDYIVVDTPPSLNEVVLAAFDQSRHLIVMATMDVPALRNLKVFLETIERLRLPAEDISCLLNKAEPDNGIDLEELLRVYPGGFAAVLPYAREVSRSLNAGQPVVMVDAKAEVSERIIEACAKLVPAADIRKDWPGGATGRGHWHLLRRHRRGAKEPQPAAAGAPGVTEPEPPAAPYQLPAAEPGEVVRLPQIEPWGWPPGPPGVEIPVEERPAYPPEPSQYPPQPEWEPLPEPATWETVVAAGTDRGQIRWINLPDAEQAETDEEEELEELEEVGALPYPPGTTEPWGDTAPDAPQLREWVLGEPAAPVGAPSAPSRGVFKRMFGRGDAKPRKHTPRHRY